MAEKEYIERVAFLRKCAETWGRCGVTIKAIEGIADECAADVVSKGVYEQAQWERDMAMQQLEEHGIPFCGVADDVVKVVRCKDCRFYGNEERHLYGGECEWISVNDRLPEDMYGKQRKRITVLVCTESGKVSTASRQRAFHFDKTKLEWQELDTFEWNYRKKVTHWMPLPEPPK